MWVAFGCRFNVSTVLNPRSLRQASRSLSFAQQRFDTITGVFRLMSLRVNTVITFLVELRAQKGSHAGWAARLLDEVSRQGFFGMMGELV